MSQCKGMTTKGKPCEIPGEAKRSGWCHIHDPSGIYQKQHSASMTMFTPLMQAKKNARPRENRIPADVYRMYFDGGGKTGTISTYGWVIKRDKTTLDKGSGVAMLGPGSTNNVAEWAALIMGLDASRGLSPLWVMGDSRLVINLASGKWSCRAATMRSLYAIAKPLLAGVNKWRWIPRDENWQADALCYSWKGFPLFVYEDLAGFEQDADVGIC